MQSGNSAARQLTDRIVVVEHRSSTRSDRLLSGQIIPPVVYCSEHSYWSVFAKFEAGYPERSNLHDLGSL